MSQAAGTEVDFLPFAKFLRKECPARVRGMLEGLYQVAWPAIAGALQRSFEQLEDDLFRHAERAPNVNEQNLAFDGQRELRRHRSDFIAACRDGVQRSLLHLIDAEVPRDQLRIGEPASGRRTQLSLVDPVHLEQVLILSEVATRAEMRASDDLNGLAYRLAVIVGGAPLELETMALGPHALCATLRVAADCFELAPVHLAALYRRIDKGLFADATGLYQTINQHLVDQGILAWLQLTPRRVASRGPDSARPPQSETAATSAPPAPEAVAEVPAPFSPPATAYNPGRSPAPPPSPGQATAMADIAAPMPAAAPPTTAVPPASAPPAARVEGPAMQALRNYLKAEQPNRPAPAAVPEPATGAAPVPASAPAAEPAASGSPDLLSFDTLRELLAGRRPAHAHADAAAPDSEQRVASEPDLDAALSALQRRAPDAPTQVGGRLVHRRVADVKRDILAQLRGRDGVQPRLSAPDSDAIDLVGFLFDHLLADQQPTSITHGLLTQLQVPLIKVALKDKAFFTQRNHPARQLLNSLMETAELWVEDEAQDSAVIDKMRWVVERVSRDYDSDAAVFEHLFEDLSRHMGGLKKKADVAERHNVEAARGKEKLELARIAAVDHVRQRLERADPPAAVRTLLESAWTDVIALAYLRQGYEHPQTLERLDFVDRLIELYGHGRPLPERRFEVQKLRSVFEDGLTSIGLHDDAVSRAWGDISRLVEEQGDESAHVAATTVRELVERQPRLGEVRKDPAAAAARPAAEPTRTLLQTLRKEAALPLSPREAEMAERVKRLPFGTWFEFTTNQQGDKVRRKLCWFSPVTGHCLFVNVRGAKALERTIDDLARDLVRGNVRLVEDKKENLIDRAWKGIVAMLRGAGLSGSDAPAAAN
jgi:hypothetical protein